MLSYQEALALARRLEEFRKDRRDAHGIGPEKRLDSYGLGYDDAIRAVIDILDKEAR
jgi:hypothetical protein